MPLSAAADIAPQPVIKLKSWTHVKLIIQSLLARPKRFRTPDPQIRSLVLSQPGLGGAVRYAICQLSRASGADPIETRRGFAELFDRIEDHAVRVVKQK